MSEKGVGERVNKKVEVDGKDKGRAEGGGGGVGETCATCYSFFFRAFTDSLHVIFDFLLFVTHSGYGK